MTVQTQSAPVGTGSASSGERTNAGANVTPSGAAVKSVSPIHNSALQFTILTKRGGDAALLSKTISLGDDGELCDQAGRQHG